MNTEKKIVILASGGGSNAKAIIQYFLAKNIELVACILSNKIDAGVHEIAKQFDIPSFSFNKEERVAGKMMEKIDSFEPDLVVLAGYLLKIPKKLIEKYPNRIVNIHPALLPRHGGKGMYGMNVHRAVIDAKDEESGITIHFVNENYDKGQIIEQFTCKVVSEDDAESLQKKVLKLEHENFPQVIEKILDL